MSFRQLQKIKIEAGKMKMIIPSFNVNVKLCHCQQWEKQKPFGGVLIKDPWNIRRKWCKRCDNILRTFLCI